MEKRATGIKDIPDLPDRNEKPSQGSSEEERLEQLRLATLYGGDIWAIVIYF